MALGPPFTFVRFGTRLGFAAFLLFSTYNPSGHSYYHWLTADNGDFLSIKMMVGLLLTWMYFSLVPIIWTAMGPIGLGMTIAWMTASGLVLWDYGFLDQVRPSFYPYAVIGSIAFIIALGLTWGHINLQLWHLKLVRKIAPKQL